MGRTIADAINILSPDRYRRDTKRRRSCLKPVASATQSGEQWGNSEIRVIVTCERQGGARMAGKNWQIEGRYVEYCSCDHGCPCETMADPTYGNCTGLVAFKIDKGWCEDVPLDDLSFVGTFYFPRALHHGQGVFQPILDERADEAQRNALFYILSGEDQPVGTMFQIFSVCIETIKDPLFAKIEFDWDLDKRRARIEVAGVVRAHSEPIRNPVTDREEQMILVLPKGWVFHEAENASGFAKGLGAIKFDLNGRHSSLAHVAWNQNGLLHTYDEYKLKFGRP
jgi:hypothetical protein